MILRCSRRAYLHACVAIWLCAVPMVSHAQTSEIPDPADPATQAAPISYKNVTDTGENAPSGIDAPRLPWKRLFRSDGSFVPESELRVVGDGTKSEVSAASDAPAPSYEVMSTSPQQQNYDARGIVRAVYPSRQRIKLKHGPIEKFDMPGMTMVFRVADPALLNGVGEGDELDFKIDMDGPSFVITGFEPSKKGGDGLALSSMTSTSDSDARGVVKAIYPDRQKLKLKHGRIDKLDMPGMTMVFRVQDPALLERVQENDEIGFTIEMQNGAFVITGIQK